MQRILQEFIANHALVQIRVGVPGVILLLTKIAAQITCELLPA